MECSVAQYVEQMITFFRIDAEMQPILILFFIFSCITVGKEQGKFLIMNDVSVDNVLRY